VRGSNLTKRVLLWALVATACTTQGRYVPLTSGYRAYPESHPVLVYQHELPDRPFVRVSRIDVHLEKTHFVKSDLEDALPELQRQARLSGAGALIEIDERTSSIGETQVYHVSAIGVRFTDGEDP
jgi:hypothetical protein